MTFPARRSRFPFHILAILAIVLSLGARLWLSWLSWGTDDATLWMSHIANMRRSGMLETYRREISFNHPPLAAMMMRGAASLGELMHWPTTFALRLPAIGADIAAALLLWRMFARRGRSDLGAIVAILMAFNLDAFLVSAHHTNTDSLYALLVLLAAWLATEQRLFAAGIALGAAINVKLLPAILVIPLLASCRSRRDFYRAIVGLAIMAAPFAVVAVAVPEAFLHRVVSYTPKPDYWGIQLFLLDAARAPRLSAMAEPMVQAYSSIGRFVILLAVAYSSLRCRRIGRSPLIAMACAACMFLVFTSGYGFQYSVLVVPILLACSLFHGTLYGILAGLYLLFSYLCAWDGTFPISTVGSGGTPYRGPALALGVLAWGTLIHFLWRALTTRASSAESNPLA